MTTPQYVIDLARATVSVEAMTKAVSGSTRKHTGKPAETQRNAFDTSNRKAIQRWMRILVSLRTGDPPQGWEAPSAGWRPNATNFAKAFGCNPRTIQRDISALRDIDYEIEYDEAEHRLAWVNMRAQEPLPLMKASQNEVLALLAAFAISGAVLDSATAQYLGSFLEKLEEHIPDGWTHPLATVQRALDYKQSYHPPEDKKLWTRLLHAIITQRGISMEYRRAYDTPKFDTKKLLPIHMTSISGVWYLFALQHPNPKKHGPNFYRLSRMRNVRIRSSIKVPDEVDLDVVRKSLEKGFGPWLGYDEETYRFRIDDKIIHLVQERQWNPGHSFRKQKDGKWLLEFRSTGGLGLKTYVMGWLDHIEVLEPQWLREEIATTAAKAAKVHRG